MPTKTYDYFTFGIPEDTSVAVINEFYNIEDPWELNTGVRIGKKFPPHVEADLSNDWGNFLTDILYNTDKVVPISESTRVLFESEGLCNEVVEYLPFTLKNKKGRTVTKPSYYIANPLLKYNCLDRERSQFSTLDNSDKVVTVKKLYILKDLVPDNAKFFRLGEEPKYIIFRSDLISKIQNNGLTGFCPCPMGEKIW